MIEKSQLKAVIWLGGSRKDISKFPLEVKRTIGHALYFAQMGDRYFHTKVMKGLGSGIYEIIEDHKDGTFRVVFAVKYSDKVYVLHAFQKKSKSGIKTPTEDINLIKQRIKQIKEIEND